MTSQVIDVRHTSSGSNTTAFGAVEWLLVLGSGGVWGSSFVLIAWGLDSLHPGLITALRLLFGAATLALFRRARAPVAREAWGRIVLLAIFWMIVPLYLFPVAQQWIDSSLAGMLNGGVPIWSALVAAILSRRLPHWQQTLGLVTGLAGVVAISWPAVQGAHATALGAGLVLFASACYGIALNVAAPLRQKYGTLPSLLRAQLISVVALIPLGIYGLPHSTFAWHSLSATVILGAFGTGLAFVAMTTLVGRTDATRGSVAIYFIPVVAIILGVVLRGEQVHSIQLFGTALVLTGAYLASRPEKP